MKPLLRALVGWYITRRTQAVIADQECRHDGTEPRCSDCVRNACGW